jgi:hypothetical protein
MNNKKIEERFNDKHQEEFKVGEKILLNGKIDWPNGLRKLQERYRGPYLITKSYGNRSFKISLPG